MPFRKDNPAKSCITVNLFIFNESGVNILIRL